MIPKKIIFIATALSFIMMICIVLIFFSEKECTFNLENGEFSKLDKEKRGCYINSIEKDLNSSLKLSDVITLLGYPDEKYEKLNQIWLNYDYDFNYILIIKFNSTTMKYEAYEEYAL